MITASLTGLVKTTLMIIGALVALRLIGRVMIAKRNLEEERELLKRERDFQRERTEKLKSFGKVSVIGRKQKTSSSGTAEDVDFEEIR